MRKFANVRQWARRRDDQHPFADALDLAIEGDARGIALKLKSDCPTPKRRKRGVATESGGELKALAHRLRGGRIDTPPSPRLCQISPIREH
jgi:hypothetical protein